MRSTKPRLAGQPVARPRKSSLPPPSERPSGVFLRDTIDPLARLASLALRGDTRSERELIERLTRPLRRYLKRALHSSDEAEDTLQETLMAIFRALPNYRGQSSFLHFSIGIARRSSLARRRSLWRHAQHSARVAELQYPRMTDARAHAEALEARRRSALVELISALPEEQARALVLRTAGDHSLSEVANATGACVNTVRTRLRLARNELKKRIAGDSLLHELLAR